MNTKALNEGKSIQECNACGADRYFRDLRGGRCIDCLAKELKVTRDKLLARIRGRTSRAREQTLEALTYLDTVIERELLEPGFSNDGD